MHRPAGIFVLLTQPGVPIGAGCPAPPQSSRGPGRSALYGNRPAVMFPRVCHTFVPFGLFPSPALFRPPTVLWRSFSIVGVYPLVPVGVRTGPTQPLAQGNHPRRVRRSSPAQLPGADPLSSPPTDVRCLRRRWTTGQTLPTLASARGHTVCPRPPRPPIIQPVNDSPLPGCVCFECPGVGPLFWPYILGSTRRTRAL